MKRKLLWLLVGLLVGSGVAAATLVQAGGDDKGTQTVETDDAEENEGSEVEDADEPGDDDGPGEVEDD